MKIARIEQRRVDKGAGQRGQSKAAESKWYQVNGNGGDWRPRSAIA
jgi:hypothetical protein